MAKKFYMETKKGTLEQSVMDVWEEAADMHAEGMDGRTKEYRSHRSKLESNRTRKENKKNTVKTEQPETEHGAGEHAYEVGTERYVAYTELVTPGQIREFLEGLSEEEFDNILEDADEELLEGFVTIMSEENVDEGIMGKVAGAIAKKAGSGIAKAAKRYGTTSGRAAGLEKKVKKVKQKQKDKASIVKSKATLKTMKKENQMAENRNLVNTIKNLWIEAASSAVDPMDREELDKEPDARGGAETAKKMKRATEPVPGQMTEGTKAEYEKFFNTAMKKFKINSPADLKSDEEKKKFYDYIDKNYTGEKDEEMIQLAKEFKVSSMREALRKVWNIGEGELPPALKKAIDAKKKDKDDDEIEEGGTARERKQKLSDLKKTRDHEYAMKHGKKNEDHDDDEDEKSEKTLTGKKKAAVDVNPDLVASKNH